MEGIKNFLYSALIDPKSIFAAIAIVVSTASFTYTLIDRSRVRIDAILEGLRGDRASVTYTALHIRLTKLLSRRKYRRAIISALLLAWNFELSDRARASVLMALLEAKKRYLKIYEEVVADLKNQFKIYGTVKGEGEIEKRGTARLEDVLSAIDKAEKFIQSSNQVDGQDRIASDPSKQIPKET